MLMSMCRKNGAWKVTSRAYRGIRNESIAADMRGR